MCVIIASVKGNSFPFEKLRVAAINNPHGFGIVAVTGKKLEVFHRFNEKGNDPEEVAKAMERYKDCDMQFLHLRYTTKGTSSRENVHPFTVYKRDGKRVEFMHNGSFGRFISNDEKVKSDTRQFAENFVTPLLTNYITENGPADIEDPFLEKVMQEYFHNSCRGLLVANDQRPLFLGGWSKYKAPDDVEYIVSNTDYFVNIQSHRATEHYKPSVDMYKTHTQHQTYNGSTAFRGAYEDDYYGHGSTAAVNTNDSKEGDVDKLPFGSATKDTVQRLPAPSGDSADSKTTTNKDSTNSSNGGVSVVSKTTTGGTKFVDGKEVVALKDINLKSAGRFLAPDDMGPLIELPDDISEFDSDLINAVCMFTELEWINYVHVNPKGAARFLEHLAVFASVAIEETENLLEKKASAEKRIADLTFEINEMKKGTKNVA